jgi:hypothetical protein
MRKLILFLPLLLLMVFSNDSTAQKRTKGFDYAGHHRMNMKAKRWGKHRLKAAKNDQTNLRCSVRTSRRAARHQRAGA